MERSLVDTVALTFFISAYVYVVRHPRHYANHKLQQGGKTDHSALDFFTANVILWMDAASLILITDQRQFSLLACGTPDKTLLVLNQQPLSIHFVGRLQD